MNCNTEFSKFSRFSAWGRASAIATAMLLVAAGMAAAKTVPPAPAANGEMNAPIVKLQRAKAVAIRPGRAVYEVLVFQVQPGYHVNSNHPNSAFLIPTKLDFATAHTGITIKAIRWPQPRELKFQFFPKPLAVFSGTFPVRIQLRAAPGARSQVLRGKLQYQACNDRLCRPPANLPVAIRLTVR